MRSIYIALYYTHITYAYISVIVKPPCMHIESSMYNLILVTSILCSV